MDLSDLLKNRSSIRRYKDEKLSDDIVKSLVESSITAPSPSNSQPVRYFHLFGDDIKKDLRDDMDEGYLRLLKEAESVAKPKKARNLIRYYWRFSSFMFDSPNLFCVGTVGVSDSIEKLKKSGIEIHPKPTSDIDISVGLSLMSFIIKAESIGVSTCILTAPFLFINKWENRPEFDGITLKSFITCGYPDESPEKTPRKPFNEIFRKL